MDFRESVTKDNLMRAFAGESQARNRYTFAAETAKKQGLYVIESIFQFTAKQEEAHAKVFYEYLNELAKSTIHIDGSYPIDLSDQVTDLLEMAVHNEYEEYDDVYKSFAETAREEGFAKVAASFQLISEIEKVHGDRFKKFAELLKERKLFVSDQSIQWMCLNCGHVYNGTNAPKQCPVCGANQGYFIRMELSPYNLG